MKTMFLAWLVLLGAGCSGYDAGRDVVKQYPVLNPGFEEAGAKDTIPGWTQQQHAGQLAYSMARDTEVHAGGSASFRVARTREQVYGGVTQNVPIPGASGNFIEFSAMLRSRDVGPLGWGLSISMPGAQADSALLTGSTEWKRVAVKVRVPPGADSLTINANLLDSGTGWIDDAQVRSIKP